MQPDYRHCKLYNVNNIKTDNGSWKGDSDILHLTKEITDVEESETLL